MLGQGGNRPQLRYRKFPAIPRPKQLMDLSKIPCEVSQCVPSTIPEFDEGCYITCVSSSLITGNYDLLYSSAKPWSLKATEELAIHGNGKTLGKHHHEYFTLHNDSLKRQGGSQGAVAAKRRTTHFSGLITKMLFTLESSPFAVIAVELHQGWRDVVGLRRSYLPRPVCNEIRAQAEGRKLDSDHIRGKVELRTGVLPDRTQEATTALFGLRRNPTPTEARIVTQSALDVPSIRREEYINSLRVCDAAKGWALENQENIEDCSLEKRLSALAGVPLLTSNGCEALNRQIKVWTGNSRALPDAVDNLHDRMCRIDQDLSHAVMGTGTEIACPRANEMDKTRAQRLFGVESVCTDSLSQLPLFAEIEGVYGWKHTMECRRKASVLQMHFWDDNVFAFFDPLVKEGYTIDLTKKCPCSCKEVKSLCPHLLLAWSSLEERRARAEIQQFLMRNQNVAQKQQFEETGCGSKSGRKRRRGTASTRRRNNMAVQQYVCNPYGDVHSDEDSSVYSISDSEDIADMITDITRAIDSSFTGALSSNNNAEKDS